ncbi:hypothetical protein [Pseudomonas sp. 2FE]|uniref:hypothetical protein n=1 Tax=Pseudomonas sp. 2FE TaxID=2502190 RepID=UPI0010F83610|nr:hypothetical protein [Pseudomonas sp. 2FE]
MASETLKVKVLSAYGFLVATLGALYVPHVMTALLPFVFCVALAVVLMNADVIFKTIVDQLRNRPKRLSIQASKARPEAPTTSWCDHIDYENYYIPTYLRRGEEA